MDDLFRFPNPVNEVSARLVAAGVVVMCAATLAFDQRWIIVPLAYGFVARVLTGPTLSPLGQFVTRVLTPALPFAEKLVPGPPKRFAQGIGAFLSVTALVLAFGFDETTAAYVCVGADPRRGDARVGVRVSASAARSSRCSCVPASSPSRCARSATTSGAGPDDGRRPERQCSRAASGARPRPTP